MTGRQEYSAVDGWLVYTHTTKWKMNEWVVALKDPLFIFKVKKYSRVKIKPDL